MNVKRFGRTHRNRKKKALQISKSELYHDPEESFHLLNKWMGHNGFKPIKKLKPRYFKETGRGLMAEENISIGDLIVSIPDRLLVSPEKIFNSDLGNYFKRYCPKATGHQILSVFLMCEQAKSKISEWYPYIKNLPQTYDIPAFSDFYTFIELPGFISSLVAKQIELVRQSYNQLELLLKKLEFSSPLFQNSLHFERYKWAWCTVNTRSVYINCFQDSCSGKSCSFHLALVPYLDLLNHSAEVQVQAGFNNSNKRYEIRSLCNFQKYSQVFINYGPHDNRTLLVEYGFVVPNNCNDFIPFSIEDITSAYKQCCFESSLFSSKLEFIFHKNLIRNSNCSCDGLSWNLGTILKILVSNYPVMWWKSRLSNYKTMFVDDELKYFELKRKLLSLKLNNYTCDFVHKEKLKEKYSYLYGALIELFSFEKLILIKAMQ